MARALVPRGCTVHSIHLSKAGAEVRFRCGMEHGEREYISRDRKGAVTSISNYPSKKLRGVRTVRLPGGITISGSADVHGFASCRRTRGELSCKPAGGGSGLGGLTVRRRFHGKRGRPKGRKRR